ncbi:MAG: hypothetical protein DAHOPDDO_00569 [Ignavibacteriaceae bacterium]|jgi:hypothetical protein|nr:hypothetical protein [Ignavibacteriaceae bacterium]
MKLKRNYFYSIIIIFVFPIIIYSCLDQDSQRINPNEQPHSDSKQRSLPSEIRYEASKDTFIFNIHPYLSDYIFIQSIDTLKVIREIEIFSSVDSQLIQNISLEILSQRPQGYDFFFTKDFNFDGYKDLVLIEEYSGTGNISYCVWIYNKSKNIFETDDFFRSIDSPILDAKKKQMTTYVEYGGFDEYFNTTYKLNNGKFILLYELKYWRDYKGDSYLQMRDSSIRYGDTLKLISRKIYGP